MTQHILQAQRDHHMTDYQDRRDPSQMHHFFCSCGQKFWSSVHTTVPRGIPSKPAVHRAEMIAKAMGVQPNMVNTVGELALAPLGSVIRDAEAIMLQLRERYGEIIWESQNLDYHRIQDVALPAEIWWAPEPDSAA